MRQGYRRSKKT